MAGTVTHSCSYGNKEHDQIGQPHLPPYREAEARGI
jgi:hypothetical protein